MRVPGCGGVHGLAPGVDRGIQIRSVPEVLESGKQGTAQVGVVGGEVRVPGWGGVHGLAPGVDRGIQIRALACVLKALA